MNYRNNKVNLKVFISHQIKYYMVPKIAALMIVICFISCNKYPNNIEIALRKAGGNRVEIEKLLSHYNSNPKDSLKLKAAYFLIENMDGWFYYSGKQLDNYSSIFQSLNESVDTTSRFNNMNHLFGDKVAEILESYRMKYGFFSKERLEIIKDIESLNANYLINNIDMAFKVWQEQPWGKDINFKQFCEFILPYRISDEKPDYDRKEIYNLFNYRLDSVRKVNGDAIMACKIINNILKSQGWTYSDAPEFMPSFGAKVLMKERIGVCREMTEIAVFVMRAVGIPVSIDFTPQWPNRNEGHYWNVVLAKNGKTIAFTGLENNPYDTVEFQKKAKVYRKTFSMNPFKLSINKQKDEIIPMFFENLHIIDVSDEYFNGSNVKIKTNISARNEFAYLALFNNQDWIPIQYGKINKDNTITFEKMGKDIVYLPIIIENGIIPIGPPILLDKWGKINYLVLDITGSRSMKVKRKYPNLNVQFRLGRMVGGKFQGANSPNFVDAVTLFEINKVPSIFYNTKFINSKSVFRYLRYYGPQKSQGNIAELEFYTGNSNIPLKGKVIGTVGSWSNLPQGVKEKAFDGDTETFFDAPLSKADSSWVGIDLGKNNRKSVNKIRYMPANDGNNIIKGNDYGLFYWDIKTGWFLIERRYATSDSLEFKSVPSNALYLIHNYTKGVEERIFTYENDEQVWW